MQNALNDHIYKDIYYNKLIVITDLCYICSEIAIKQCAFCYKPVCEVHIRKGFMCEICASRRNGLEIM